MDPTTIASVIADLCDMAGIARMAGVKRNTVNQWQQRGLLPEPVARFGGVPVWYRPGIVAWLKNTGRKVVAP